MSNNRTRRSRNTYTPNMRKPSSEKSDHRVATSLILLFLLPPIGIFYCWRNGVFRQRGRIVMTAVSMLEMAFLLFLVLPAPAIPVQFPVPQAPAAATVVPQGAVLNALSNIDELVVSRQAAEIDESVTPEPTDQAAYMAEQEAILQTIVYSVYGSSAKYYHSVEICGTQTNRRALTVQEALSENMGACPNCNPPIYTG